MAFYEIIYEFYNETKTSNIEEEDNLFENVLLARMALYIPNGSKIISIYSLSVVNDIHFQRNEQLYPFPDVQ